MANRFINALVKLLLVLVVAHVLLLIIGAFIGTNVGFFGLRMLWPHWSTWMNALIAIVCTGALYAVIYCFFTKDQTTDNM